MRVRDVMTSPAVTCPPGMSVKAAARLLVEHAIGGLPVVDGGELVGIVSEADLVQLEAAPDPRAHLIPSPAPTGHGGETVGDVMTRDVVSLPADADAAEAARVMLERRIASIPVVHGATVVGIVARRDLLRMLVRDDADIARELERLLAEELGEPAPFRVSVADGAVALRGDADQTTRRLAVLLARGVPGVVAVEVEAPGA